MKQTNALLFGSVILILLAVGLVAILDRTSQTTSSTDVRAKAGQVFTLKLTGVVDSVDETNGVITVGSVQFDQESRSGDAKNLGTWTVTPPANFNFASLTPGTFITIGVDAKTFVVTSHQMTAVTLVPTTR